MCFLAAATGLLLLFIPLTCGASKPGLTAEFQTTETVMLMGLAQGTQRIEVLDDRSRVEYRIHDSPSRDEVRIEIVRTDRGVRWVLYPDKMNYEEYPWPDTASPALKPVPADVVAELPDSLRNLKREKQSPKRHVSLADDRPVIHGFATKHYVIWLDPEPAPAGQPAVDFGSVNDLWIATDLRDEAEIKRLMEVAGRHARLSQPNLMGDSQAPDPIDSLGGVPVRTWIRIQVMDPAELAKQPPSPAAKEESSKGYDAKTGMVTLLDHVMTSAQIAPIPAEDFELPAGYKKLSHSPR